MAPAAKPRRLILSLIFVLASCIRDPVLAKTNSADVSALNVMYTSLNSPSQLSGWNSNGGDPCDDGWKGIECSGSSVTEIDLSGLGLSGSLGYQLSNLNSVTYFDLSKNNFKGDIPYQLPPNADHIDLSQNAFTGGIPYSISQMSDLKYLSLAHNQLTGQLSDMFGNLQSLSSMDISFNGFSGDLPQSFKSMKSLESLNIQNNQFSGSLSYLTDLSLNDLNIQNNHFSGWIPDKLKRINNLKVDGNSWSSGPPPKGMSKAENQSDGQRDGSGLGGVAIAGIVLCVLVALILILALFKGKSSESSHYIDDNSQNRPFTPLVGNDFEGLKESSMIDIKAFESSSSFGLKPPHPEQHRSFNDNEFAIKFGSRRSTDSAVAIAYALADIQAATANFSASHLLGQGTIGRVYKAKFDEGKVLAVKNLDTLNFSGRKSYDFTEVVSSISKLHHPNISELLGYCSEPGCSLLVYEFQRNGSLHGFLHLSDDYSKPLTWDTRVRIALGTARAVEYLHEVCSPSLLHENIKSSNILLDAELNPHLSDCGLAEFYEDTSENLGAGYNAPECTKPSAYTMKSDVYSFGVVMLELLTGRKPFDSSRTLMEQSLVRWATPQLHDIDALSHMVDPALRGLYPPKSLSRFADVIALCIQSEPEFRPAMSEVVQSLVRCVQRTSFSKRLGGDLSASRRSDDSDY